MGPKNNKWEKDWPLVKLISDGINSMRSKDSDAEERPMSYEEWQLKKKREAGFLY